MKDKRFAFGIAASAIWIILAVWVMITQKHPNELNEWGDFIAGFSAPLAFLWLVLGYMQQGEELKHSTEALQLQAEELKNSVEQQTQLVLVAREQMRLQFDALEDERKAKREAARPKFIPQQSSIETDDTGNIQALNMSIVNIGPTATKFRLQIDFNNSILDDGKALFKSEERKIYSFLIPVGSFARVSIEYVDSMGYPGTVEFFAKRTQRRHLEFTDTQPQT